MLDSSEPKSYSPPPSFNSKTSSLGFRLGAIVGFVALVAGVFLVVIILPGLSTKRNEEAEAKSRAEPVQSGILAQEESAAKAQDAQEALQKVLKLQARLENERVKIWGAEPLVTSYEQALASRAQADAYLDKQLFDQAAKGYRDVYAQLEQLAASRPERIHRALQAGDNAFAQLNAQLAQQFYETALAADSENSKAKVGLQRAKNLPEVLEHLARGRHHETNSALDLARQDYQKALSLDKEFQTARDHLQNVDASIQSRDFGRFVSEAINALQKEAIEQARQALAKAKDRQPDHEKVRELEQQLRNTEQRTELQRLRRDGLQHEQAEEWAMAIKAYGSALNIDASAGFAQAGKSRAEHSMQVSQQVHKYISDTNLLQVPEHMRHARQVYETALVNKEIGPKFRDDTKKLHQLLDFHARSVPVIIESDNLTEVMIYRIGKLGRLVARRLELRPGQYKVLGSRPGYRDVIILFTVPVGAVETKLNVFCQERL